MNEANSDKTNSLTEITDDAFNPQLMAEIVPGLWIGNFQSLRELTQLRTTLSRQRRRWTVISVLQSDTLLHLARVALLQPQPQPQLHAQQENDASSECSSLMIEGHMLWQLSDNSQADFLSPQLEQALRTIDHVMLTSTTTDTVPQQQQQQEIESERAACLVHCFHGVSRSAAVCAAWLMVRRKWSMAEALESIRRVRPQIHPNLGFIAGLHALQQCHGNVAAARERLTEHTDTDA